MRLIHKSWPIWIRILLAPFVLILFAISLPIVLILMAAGEGEKAQAMEDLFLVS